MCFCGMDSHFTAQIPCHKTRLHYNLLQQKQIGNHYHTVLGGRGVAYICIYTRYMHIDHHH